MNLVNSVFETAEKFMDNSMYVDINDKKLELVAKDMIKRKPKRFPNQNDDKDEFKSCLLQLIGGSINYCYWYGSSFIRPGESSSTKMFEVVEYAFKPYNRSGGIHSIDKCLDDLIKYLSMERFPLLEERIRHLNELRLDAHDYIKTVIQYKDEKIEFLLNSMVQIFPGYASDIFLKRAFLFFAQLNRIFGWFEEDMHNIPVPADYQVPKMLQQYGILDYDEELQEAIETEQHLPKWSAAECEIRAATILACQQLCKKTKWSMPDVDAYFWLRRKEAINPFHLTVTTDY